jgi:hypothetical protein
MQGKMKALLAEKDKKVYLKTVGILAGKLNDQKVTGTAGTFELVTSKQKMIFFVLNY